MTSTPASGGLGGSAPRPAPSGGLGGLSPRLALRNRPAWAALGEHYEKIRDTHLRDLFAGDPRRGERLTAEAAGLYLDYSKNRITDTENRSVLHVALRMPREATLIVGGIDVVAQVHEVLDAMAAFAGRIRSGDWRGFTGLPITAVVNIGIGGSDLGPVMAYEALRYYADQH